MTTTVKTDPVRQLLLARMEALLNNADGTQKSALSADEGAEFDALKFAVDSRKVDDNGILQAKSNPGGFIHATTMDYAHPPVRRSASGNSSRTCASMFGVSHPSTGGFNSLEQVAKAIMVGDSHRVMALSGQSIGSPSDGGFAVPESFMFEVLDKSLESEIVRPRCRVEPMTGETLSISTYDDSTHASGELFGGLTGQWIGEGEEIDYKIAKLRRLKLVARKLGFLTAASNELLSDAPGYEGGFTARMSAALNWNLDRTFLVTGTGAGQPKSVLNDAATIVVAKEGSQAADTLVYQNLAKMFARLHPSCLGNSVWVVNQTAIPQLLELTIAVGTGGTVIPVMTGANGEFQILTRPVVFTEKLNPLGDLGDIMLVDFSQYAAGIMRGGLRLDRSQHVKFTTDESVWRIILRADGQGTWGSSFTPVNGSTLSWAVTLAARA